MMKKSVMMLVYLLMLALFSISVVSAEPSKPSSASQTIAETGPTGNNRIKPEQWLQDTGEVFTSPKHWDSANWNNFLLYGGLTYLTYENDDHIQSWFQEKRSKKTNNLANIGNSFPAVGAVYLTGTYFLGNERQQKVAANGLESMGIAVLATEVIKTAAHRDRPNGDSKSFPSTHTAAAFALATVIADEYRDENKAVPYFAYGLAALTAYGRLNDNKHWGSDVVAGAVIGFYTAKTVGKIHDSRKVQLQPYISSETRGVVASKHF